MDRRLADVGLRLRRGSGVCDTGVELLGGVAARGSCAPGLGVAPPLPVPLLLTSELVGRLLCVERIKLEWRLLETLVFALQGPLFSLPP